MALRPCLDCGSPTAATRCKPCRSTKNRDRDAGRGTSRERGYDATFEALKKNPAYLAATHCATCGSAFTPDNPKTAGHVVAIRNGGRAIPLVKAECRRCNYGWRASGS